MAVVIDVSAAVHRRAGLGRYAESLVRALVRYTSGEYALFYNRERGIEPLASLESLRAYSVALGYKPWRMLVWLGQLARVGFDWLVPGAELFHATEHLLLPLRGVPTVLTVHDLIFRHLPAHHKPLNRWYLNWTMPLYCRRATRVIAVSQHTRQDLIALYGVAPEKVTVVYEAADPRFRPQQPERIAEVRARYGLPSRYLLFVGTLEPRKNLVGVLEAFERVYAGRLTDGLVVVGKRGWLYEGFFARLEASPARQAVLFPGYVPDEDLPAIYAGAQALVFPSFYEGFGLPVLEAMACGTPVVCSDRGSLPEVAGDAALLVDPGDGEAIVEAVRSLLSREDLREVYRRRGLERAGQFSWERAARETVGVYCRVLGG